MLEDMSEDMSTL